jgi:membrane-bound lytic murein transglycosylase D
VSRRKDQRTDPYKSTVTAATILKNLHKMTGSWPLAITAYNYGKNGMRRAIKKYGPDYMKIRKRHKTRIFGFAAKNYYPSFLAVRNIATKLTAKRKPHRASSEKLASGESSRGRLSF